MTTTKFLTSRVQFNSGGSTLNSQTSVTFPTDIQEVTAAVQSWKILTSSDREIRNFNLIVDNIQPNGCTASCDITLTLASGDPKWSLEASNCWVDLVFIAVCD